MNLPINGILKRKDSYEAADSGIGLWRSNFVFFIIFFAIPFWVSAFLIRSMFSEKAILFSWLILWWIKPFFDRTILHVVSIRFFEPNADLKRLFRGLGGNLIRGLFGDLTWRRFSPFRAATIPVRVLEYSPSKKQKNTKKTNNSERIDLLKKGGLGYCFILSFWGIMLELMLLLSEITFLMLINNLIGNETNIFESSSFYNIEIFIFSLWCFNYIIVESIFICMGFGVYINSRIEIEGWDLEIHFKNLGEKLKKKKDLGVSNYIIPLLICFFTLFTPVIGYTENYNQTPFQIEAPLEILEEVLSSQDFGAERDSWQIKLKKTPEPESIEKSLEFLFSDQDNFLRILERILSGGLRVIAVLIITALIIVILIFSLKYLKNRKNDLDPNLYSLYNINKNGKPEYDPEILLNKAIEQHTLREAWGYCAASAILLMQIKKGIVFPANATENECISIAKSKLGETSVTANFSFVINNWIQIAYAEINPDSDSFEKAIEFCKSLINLNKENKNG